MKKMGEIALGVVTSIGGFLEVGSIATAVQSGSEFRFQLAWALLLGTVSLAILMEMTGRLAAVSKRTYGDQLRERFGVRFFLAPLIAVLLVSFLVVASEIGGVSMALQLVTGISFRWWVPLVALVGWVLLWRGTFKMVEQGTAALGLIAVVFLVAAVKLHPDWGQVTHSLLPSGPSKEGPRYWYLAVAILGASISPYLYLFYSAGAIEDKWTTEHIPVNRLTSGLGNLFGGGLAIMVLVVAAMVFGPSDLKIEQYTQVGAVLITPLGKAGLFLFAATLFITCFGATVEITLSMAYVLAQGFGWAWSEDLHPGKDARFATAYSVVLLLATIPAAAIEPLKLTNISMVVSAASLPVTVLPLLLLMNDRDVMGEQTNGWPSNSALIAISLMSIVLLLVAVPLQLRAGG